MGMSKEPQPAQPSPKGQALDKFLARKFPAAGELMQGVLFTRDQISLTGRRRDGKTLLASNIALAGASEMGNYLGFVIPEPFTSLVFYLEDDPEQLQKRLARSVDGLKARNIAFDPDRFHLKTRYDVTAARVAINLKDDFKSYVQDICAEVRPQLIVFDNLGKLIGGAYNDSEVMESLMNWVFGSLATPFNAAVLINAHPRKERDSIPSLRLAPEEFFEECMGSSAFINNTGSMWGLQRDWNSDRTDLLLASQRTVGDRGAITVVEKDEYNWLQPVADSDVALELACNTEKRRKAWKLIRPSPFNFTDFEKDVSSELKKTSAHGFLRELRRQRLVVGIGRDNAGHEIYQKASGAPQHTTQSVDVDACLAGVRP